MEIVVNDDDQEKFLKLVFEYITSDTYIRYKIQAFHFFNPSQAQFS
jgi:hypothetical protein